MNGKAIALVLIVVVAAGSALWWWTSHARVDVRFASDGMDLARLEHEYPLSTGERESLTPERLANYSQEEVDQIYGRLTAGPIPDGAYDGDLFFPRGTDSETRLGEIVAGHLQVTPCQPRRPQDRRAGTSAVERKGVLSRPASPA